MNGLKIEYLAENKSYLKKIAKYWCLEWSVNCDDQKIARRAESLSKMANTDAIPFVMVAKFNDELAGTGAVFKYDLNSRKDLTPWLAGVYVLKEFRNQGIASQIISRVQEEAKKLGIKRLYLHTESAAVLYQKLGWTFMDKTVNDNGLPCEIYFKDL